MSRAIQTKAWSVVALVAALVLAAGLLAMMVLSDLRGGIVVSLILGMNNPADLERYATKHYMINPAVAPYPVRRSDPAAHSFL